MRTSSLTLLFATALCLVDSSALARPEAEPTDLAGPRSTPSPKANQPTEDGTASPAAPETYGPEGTALLADRVRSFQAKPIIKRGRFALTLLGAATINDGFHTKLGGSATLSFFVHDTFAIAVRGGLWRVVQDQDVQVARQNFQLGIAASQPQWVAMADVEWSPVYGKFRVGQGITHLDASVIVGMGTVIHRSPELAFEAGLGLRFIATEWLAVNLSWLNTFYLDKPLVTAPALLQNLMSLNLGLTLFIPFTSPERSKS